MENKKMWCCKLAWDLNLLRSHASRLPFDSDRNELAMPSI